MTDLHVALRELQDRILSCTSCPYRNSWGRERLPEHGVPHAWCWWFRNKFPCEGDAHYILFRYTGELSGAVVALRPVTGWVPDTADLVLANALKRLGLVEERFEVVGDAFVYYDSRILLTDLIKCRGAARESVKGVPSSCLEFLREELALVGGVAGRRPAVVAMGRRTKELLEKYGAELGLEGEVQRIPFHSYVWARGKRAYGENAKERVENYAEAIRSALRRAGLEI